MLRPITVARYFPMMAEISDDFVEKLRNEMTIEDMRNELMSFALESKFTDSLNLSYYWKEQPRLWHILTQFQSLFLENLEVVLYNKGYQMIELFILLQLV